MESVDIIIIGAGVIGLSVAAEAAREGRSIFILEKNDSWGQEISSRNSEVIHAGIYYPAGTLKARSCAEGRAMLYDLCPQHGIGIKKTGKLIVATSDEEVASLHRIKKTAAENNVTLSFIDKSEAKKLEPQVSCVAALYSPETGIVDSHVLMKFFLEKAKSAGAELVCLAEVTAVKRSAAGYTVTIDNQGETTTLGATVVVNCAGNNADTIAAACGIDIDACGYRQYYLKGNYFRLSDKYRNTTQHLIYPVPDANSLGIHTVVDLNGGIRLGPDEQEVETLDYRVDEARKKDFYESAHAFLPFIEEDALTADMAGIRPQLRTPNAGDFKDFIISHEEDKGLPGLINLIGIESRGLTASPFIGRYVARMIDVVVSQ